VTGGHTPKFARNFMAEAADIRAAVRLYVQEVEQGTFPDEKYSFV